tara:strand:- start:1830 stop:3470 length:1641 start_codon:yes stop_codon:yes gene_type:complete
MTFLSIKTSKLNKKNIELNFIIVFLLFALFFIVGITVFRDYGISVDEWELREMGFANLKYIVNIFFSSYLNDLDALVSTREISNHYYTHGVIFALPMAFIEYIFDITDSRNYYLLRHYSNHLIFLISIFYFYLLAKNKFNSLILGIFAALFLFLSPRIFASSFFNQKDIIFMSLFIINLYYGINFLKNPNFKNSLTFSLTTAFSIDIRIMGIITVPIILFFTFLKFIENKDLKIIKSIFLYLLTFPFLTVLFWPYLWESPIENFIHIFERLSAYDWEGYVFYFGKFYKGSNLPWHYIFLWMLVSTPILYVALFIYGFSNYTLKLKDKIFNIIENKNSILKIVSDSDDLIYYLLFLIPIILVIFLNSTLYTGWRHLYFIYPCFLMISLKGLHLLTINHFKKNKLIPNVLVFIFLIHIGYTMVKMHPFQNVYFNFIAGSDPSKNFEIDYWGVSNKQAFELILNDDESRLINVGSAGPISLENSKKILKANDRKRIIISENKKADYIINNNINWHGNIKKRRYKIPENFKLYKEIYVKDVKISSIYKKK